MEKKAAPDQPVRGVSSLFMTYPGFFLLAFFLFVSLINRHIELVVLCLLTLAVAGSARLWTAFSGREVEYSAVLEKQRLFPGETARLEVSCENRKILPVSIHTSVPVDEEFRPGPGEMLTGESGLLSYEKASFSWELAAGRRGVYEIGPVGSATGDLFGFFTSEQQISRKLELIVYPRIVPVKPLEMLRRELFGVPGVKSPVNDPVYIMGTREYRGSRPAKFIHWKASARHNKLQEKIFEPTEQIKALFLIDVAGYAREDAREEYEKMLEGIASLADLLDRREISFGLASNCMMKPAGFPFLPVTYNRDQLARFLEAVARMTMRPAEGLTDILDKINLPAGLSCVFFSLCRDHHYEVLSEHFRGKKIPFTPVFSRSGEEGGQGAQANRTVGISEVFL